MTLSLFDLTNKVAIVTGAAQGMGRAMSIAMAEAGADLLLVDLNETGVRQTAKSIATLGRRAEFAVHDVSEPNQVRALFQRLDADFGRIDFLGNVAGESIMGAPEEISLEDVERSGATSCWAGFAPARKRVAACLPQGVAASSISARSPVSARWAAATSLTAWRWAPWRR